MSGSTLPLFGRDEAPHVDTSFARIERIELEDGAWLERLPGWLEGHAQVFERLRAELPFRAEERTMYERVVEVPRLYTELESLPMPILETMRRALGARYGADFDRVSAALYRDGRGSVAWHGDYVARNLPEAVVATVSVGAPRKLLVRRTGGGPSRGFTLGWGDLFVMGGTCQRTHQHAVPKVAHAEPRIVIMYRPTWS